MQEQLIPACSKQQLYHPHGDMETTNHEHRKLKLCSPNVLQNVTLVILVPITIALLTSTFLLMVRVNHLDTQIRTLRHNMESLEFDVSTVMEDYEDEDVLIEDDYELIAIDAIANASTEEDNDSIAITDDSSDSPRLLSNGTVRSRRRRGTEGSGGSGSKGDRIRKTKKIEAYHLQVDSSMYSMEIDNAGQTLNVWRPREGRRIRFGEYQNNGRFKIDRGGLFYVYSQITYYDNSGRWCHAIKKNSNIIAKCLASEWGMSVDEGTNHYVPTVHNCYTATVVYLHPDDELSITSLYGRRTIHQGTDMTFWGIVKLA